MAKSFFYVFLQPFRPRKLISLHLQISGSLLASFDCCFRVTVCILYKRYGTSEYLVIHIILLLMVWKFFVLWHTMNYTFVIYYVVALNTCLLCLFSKCFLSSTFKFLSVTFVLYPVPVLYTFGEVYVQMYTVYGSLQLCVTQYMY